MHLEKSINLPTLLCVACRASPASGIYTDGLIHAPLCSDCSPKPTSAIYAAIMETTNAVPPLKLHKHVRSRLPRQSIPCLPSRNQSE